MVNTMMGVSFDMSCPQCGKSFASIPARDMHIRDKHVNPRKVIDPNIVTVDGVEMTREEAKWIPSIQDGYRWFNANNIRGRTRQQVPVELKADTDLLYHHCLDKTIAYLQEVKRRFPNANMEEHWTGYETMYVRFVFTRPETDEEMEDRIASEEEHLAEMQREKDRAAIEADKNRRIGKLQAEIAAIRKS